MTDEDYLKTQSALMKVCVELEGLDLEGFLERAGLAHVSGAGADPLPLRRGASALAAVVAMADAGRMMASVYREHPREMLALLVETYGREALARAGIV